MSDLTRKRTSMILLISSIILLILFGATLGMYQSTHSMAIDAGLTALDHYNIVLGFTIACGVFTLGAMGWTVKEWAFNK